MFNIRMRKMMKQHFVLFVAILFEGLSTTLAFFHKALCKDHEFYFEITEKCEPCRRICDPVNMHETDCPRLCPNYRLTTTASTSIAVTNTTYTSDQAGQTARNAHAEFQTVLFITGFCVFILVNIIIGCACYKKRGSIKKIWPLRICFNHTFHSVTFKAVPTTADPKPEPQVKDESDELKPPNADNDHMQLVNENNQHNDGHNVNEQENNRLRR